MSQIVIPYLQFYSVTDEIEKIALDHSSSFIDVKIPLQCLVKNSQIVVHTSVKVSFKLSICSLITFYSFSMNYQDFLTPRLAKKRCLKFNINLEITLRLLLLRTKMNYDYQLLRIN